MAVGVRIYRGYGRMDGRVTVEENENDLGLLNHFVKHSPTGFGWGYAGSGPAELARCLLIDALQERAMCKTCGGTGRVSFDGMGDQIREIPGDPEAAGCMDCENGIAVMPADYQPFKFEFIADIPQNEDWQLTQDQIVGWYDAHIAKAGPR